MVELSPTAAVTDLLWLQKRFEGILALLPKLEEVSSLESYAAELKSSIKGYEKEQAEAAAAKSAAQKEAAAAQTAAADAIALATEKAEQIISNAKEEAEKARQAARESAANEVIELQNQKLQKQKEVATLHAKVTTLAAEIEAQQKAYDDLVSMINDLKAKF